MKKIILFIIIVFSSACLFGQTVLKRDLAIQKVSPYIHLNGLGAELRLDGATSGTAVLKPPAVAGTATITLPGVTSTIIASTDTAAMLNTYQKIPQKVQYRIGVDAAPVEGDSILTDIIFIGKTLDVYDISTPTTVTGTFECDYNIYWNNSTATNQFLSLDVGKTWAEWEGLGYEANSPNVTKSLDPLFKNAGGSYLFQSDFDLQTTSPCIDAGVDVAIDYLGTAPDIGYIEKR
jgi:hypothetical protein